MMISIRPELPEDHAAVDAVLRAAFATAAEARLVARLRASDEAIASLIGDLDGAVVGHIFFSPVSVQPACESPGAGLAPVAVLPACQRQGIGAKLINAGLAACRQSGYRWVVVLGEPEYYRRFGFRPASEHNLHSQYDAGDAFMAMSLVDGGLDGVKGVVKYSPQFDRLDEI